MLCATIVRDHRCVIGWRPDNGIAGVVAGLARRRAVRLRAELVHRVHRPAVSDPESAQAVGLMILFPLAFVSSVLRAHAGAARLAARRSPTGTRCRRWPASCRELFGNPNPARWSDNFPSQHPVFVALMWSIVIIAVCAPVASRMLRKRTTD